MDVLVLCIDRDNDLGRKGGVITPVVGREANIEAALKLGMSDPEDSDVNTIFGGIKTFDEIAASARDVEIASIAGDLKVGLISDSKLASQLEDLLARARGGEFTGMAAVLDGDEGLVTLATLGAVEDPIIYLGGLARVSHNIQRQNDDED